MLPIRAWNSIDFRARDSSVYARNMKCVSFHTKGILDLTKKGIDFLDASHLRGSGIFKKIAIDSWGC